MRHISIQQEFLISSEISSPCSVVLLKALGCKHFEIVL
jgi:hypothetical protein